MTEGSGDRQTGTGVSEDASDTDGGVHDGDTDGGTPEGTDDRSEPRAGDTDGETAGEQHRTAEVADLLAAVDDGDAAGRVVEEGAVEASDLASTDQLVGHVEDASAETVADTLGVLARTVDRLDAQLAEERERAENLEDRLRRKQAEFQNYKKRQKERMSEERERATEDLVERLVEVRDNLKRALETDEGADIRGGIESTLSQFDRELDRENVDAIEPDPGDAVDPGRHEVLATVPSEEPVDAIADVHRPGYEMAGKVLRPAQVTVSQGDDEEQTGEE